MMLVRWLARTWSALSAPPPVPLPGPRALPSYARMGRYIAGGVALEPRVELVVRQLAAELSGCRWCIEHGLHRWRHAFLPVATDEDRKSTRLNSSHGYISYAVFCLKKKKNKNKHIIPEHE